MCGILGAARLTGGSNAAIARLPLEAAASRIYHRGPDDGGCHRDDGVALAMRRLAIIDVEGGHQPLSDESGTIWLVCNGEIYNFRELRSELEQRGHRFKTGSDCEVIIHAYREFGDGFVERLSGMFAFALWDGARRRLFLGRDALGIKPLYYAIERGRLLFASELKALLGIPGFSVDVDPVALEAYLALGYTPGPLTLVKGVQKLPPASVLIVDDGEVSISTFWRPPSSVDDSLTEREWALRIRDSIESAVQAQMVSDVPIGAFLSGGIDSSAVVALMARHSDAPIRTYSIGFEGTGAESFYNELPFARLVSQRFGTEHKEIVVTPDVVKLLPKLIWHMDEPIADSALVTTYLVSEFARQDVKVILSGVGGDELFGGYRRYLGDYYGGLYRKLPGWLRAGVIQRLAPVLPSDRHSRLLNASRLLRSFLLSADLSSEERYRKYVEVFDEPALSALVRERADAPYDAILDAFEDASVDDSLLQLLLVDMRTQLPDDLLLLTDKMTMATSLECRVPLLDQELVELAARVPAGTRIRKRELKYVMKRALEGVLPDEILHRSKRGFGAPVGAWIKGQLAPVMNELLSKESIEKRGWFRWEAVSATIAAHEKNRADHTDHLSALMNLEIWSRIFIDGQSHEEVADSMTRGETLEHPLRMPSLSVSS